jgi:hypothetical protein
MNIDRIRELQERARQIEAQIAPIKVIPLFPHSRGQLSLLVPQIILRRKLRILKGLIRQAALREIDRRGWYVRNGEAYMKTWFSHWCGTCSLNHVESVRSEMRAVMKDTPGITPEEALVEVFRRRDREYELYGDVPTFLRRDSRDE